MKNWREKIYDKFGYFDFLEALGSNGLNIRWGIEAGCHNGVDTETFLKHTNIERIYAFEPDDVARSKAAERLNQHLKNRVELSNFALMDRDQDVSLILHDGIKGTGNTQVVSEGSNTNSEGSHFTLKAKSLDSFFSGRQPINPGFLWLDVEGAQAVLIGGKETMARVVLAKIEVEMHDMWGIRKANAFKVLQLMKKYGFSAQSLPIYPGNFGDIVFVRNSNLPIRLRIRGFYRVTVFTILHKFVYPILGKPTK